MKLRSIASGLLLGMAALALPQHYVEYGMNLSIGDEYIEEYRQGEQSEGLLDYSINTEGYGSVHGRANVGYGVNKAYISLEGTNAENPLDFAYGFATSRYFDYMVISDPELDGTVGTFTTNLYVEGNGLFDVSESIIQSPDTELWSFWHAVINLTAEGIEDEFGPIWQSAYYAGEWYKGFDESELFYYGDPLNAQQQEVTFQFVYGQPIFIDTFIQTDIHIDNQELVPGTISATVDLGNSAYWGGIRNVRDANGNVVGDFDFTSSSGYNYLAPVPEPGTMVALGIGALALLRRRRKS